MNKNMRMLREKGGRINELKVMMGPKTAGNGMVEGVS